MGFTVVGKEIGYRIYPSEVWEYCQHVLPGDVIQHDGGFHAVRGNYGNTDMLPLWDVTRQYIEAVDPVADLEATQDAASWRAQ
jgi:hypothetical protein